MDKSTEQSASDVRGNRKRTEVDWTSQLNGVPLMLEVTGRGRRGLDKSTEQSASDVRGNRKRTEVGWTSQLNRVPLMLEVTRRGRRWIGQVN